MTVLYQAKTVYWIQKEGNMLDDLKIIHHRDKSDALGVAAKQHRQLKLDFSKVPAADAASTTDIVLAGMGGSGLAARLVDHLYRLKKPFQVLQEYDPPEYVDADTLFVTSSYSGNTEEVLAALKQAEARKARIVVVASGGKLAKIAKDKKYPLYELPKGLQPRMATFANFAALTQLFVTNDLLEPESVDELHEAADWLATKIGHWLPDVPTIKNEAKQIAQDCIGLSPVIYGGPLLYPVAYKWKISFNENAKNVAWCNQFPEFNHNEFMGWSSHPVDKPYRVIYLRSSFDGDQISKRFDVSSKLLSGKWPHPLEVVAAGDTRLRQMLWTTVLGDFVSIYTALLNNVDPTPVELIEKLKKELA